MQLLGRVKWTLAAVAPWLLFAAAVLFAASRINSLERFIGPRAAIAAETQAYSICSTRAVAVGASSQVVDRDAGRIWLKITSPVADAWCSHSSPVTASGGGSPGFPVRSPDPRGLELSGPAAGYGAFCFASPSTVLIVDQCKFANMRDPTPTPIVSLTPTPSPTPTHTP